MSGASQRCVVLGIGNIDRGDDGAGRYVARLLRRQLPADTEVTELDGEGTAILERLKGAAAAHLVDACICGAVPGTVWRFDVGSNGLPQQMFGVSTHGFALAEALELARALGELPPRCIVHAIEGEAFELGAPLSERVKAAVAEVARRIAAEVAGSVGCMPEHVREIKPARASGPRRS